DYYEIGPERITGRDCYEYTSENTEQLGIEQTREIIREAGWL
ncbi:unnamed protein product, partial [marine sediment metagenome]